MFHYYNKYQSKGRILGYPPWSCQKMGGILWGQPFFLTIYQFFYIKLGGTVMFLSLKILRMNPGQTENEKAQASVLPETDLL